MTEWITQELGGGYRVRLKNVKKNNNVTFMGIMVTEIGKNISPTIYLESFYEKYRTGKAFESLAGEVLEALQRGMPDKDFDLGFFVDYETVRKKLCYKLIHAERNQELLKEIPYIPLLDLVICFYYPVDDEKIGQGSILIKNMHTEFWGVSVRDLWKAADQNTSRLYPAECYSMERLMLEMAGGRSWKEPADELPKQQGIPMYVLTNKARTFGSAVILYEGYLERIAACLECGFYLLPSSVHEVIILPQTIGGDRERLKEIIGEVNQMGLEKQEVLSDSLYLYDKENKRLCLLEEKDLNQ